ncbi:MAG: hybrid sensor histidine kinase/response regulator [Marinicella sp.]|nr:response regulator [Xanthomonadales bacterium]
MSLPEHITFQIYQHYQAHEWGLVTLDANNRIVQINSKVIKDLRIQDHPHDITQVLPMLSTESLEESFFIPFYNHDNLVFDIHFIAERERKYLIMVPVDLMYEKVKYNQQLAHNQELEKLRFKTLFETLETAQHELIAANKSKSFYISALSHEMGNPLNAISGYNQLLQEGSISIEQATSIIQKNVLKLNEIITQALDYDNQTTQIKLQRFKPYNLINDLLNDFKIPASQKNLKLNNQVSQQQLVISNPTKWQQIFTNLISNAIKYTNDGSITITSATNENDLSIEVADSGCGMSERFQKQLFKAWSREYKSEAQGNGIGLVISKMLAEQLNAQLYLKQSSDQGSCFSFVFPLMKDNKLKILLVDDDEDCLNLFAFYLGKDHHAVITTDSLEGLTAQLKNNDFDLLITDLHLSQHRASEIIELIKSKVKHAIVMTANPSVDSEQALLQIGFDKVLAKPLTETILRNSVTNLQQNF